MAVLAGDGLGHRHALVLGLVREHRPGDGVADGVDAGHGGLPAGVDLDLAARAEHDAELVEAEPLGVGPAAGGDQHDVGVERLLAVVLAQLVGDADAALAGLGALHRGAEDDLQALLGQQLLQRPADLEVHAGGDLVEELEHRHLGAEPGIDRAELEADDAGADHRQPLRDRGKLERAGGADDRSSRRW